MAKKKVTIEYNLEAMSSSITVPLQFRGTMDSLLSAFKMNAFSAYDVGRKFSGFGTHDDIKTMLEFLCSIGILAKIDSKAKGLYQFTSDELTVARIKQTLDYLSGHVKAITALKDEIMAHYEKRAED
jgi:hypothetical protein